jgi:ABC-type glycerol-3-phosphate transport system substrate-binding protein
MDSLLTGFDSVQMLEDQFDGRAVYIGYPSTTSSGSALYLNNSLAISASSSQKEAAWAFIKYFLTGDHYNSRGGWSLLTEKYEDSIEIAKANEVSQATIDTTERLINSIDHTTVYQEEIFAIIQEETESMFAGDKTAEDIAPIIQQRVMIYLSENS